MWWDLDFQVGVGICVERVVNLQSLMNSQRCRSELSVVSGTALIRLMMEVTYGLFKVESSLFA